MDIASALAILSPIPLDMHQEYYICAGAYHPVIIPTATLSLEQHHVFLSHGHSSDPEIPFLIALKIDDQKLAWTLYDRIKRSHIPSPQMSLQMQLWIARELALRKLSSADRSATIVIHSTIASHRKKIKTYRRIYNSITKTYSSLPKVLWNGPLIIEDSTQSSIEARPLLPIIQLDAESWTDVHACQQFSSLMLQRLDPPPQGWPLWLSEGFAAVALAQYRGQGPSPRKMLRIRAQAGEQAIFHCWNAASQIDSTLAQALAAPLLHSRHKHKLASFLDLIRNDIDTASAYRIAYGLSIDDLLQKR